MYYIVFIPGALLLEETESEWGLEWSRSKNDKKHQNLRWHI